MGGVPRTILRCSSSTVAFRCCLVGHLLYGVTMVLLHLMQLLPPYNDNSVRGLTGERPVLELFDLYYSVRVRDPRDRWFGDAGALMTLWMGQHGAIVGLGLGIWALVSVFGVALVRNATTTLAWGWTMRVQLLLFVWIQASKVTTVCRALPETDDTGDDIFPFQEIGPDCNVMGMLLVEHTVLVTCIAWFLVWLLCQTAQASLPAPLADNPYSDEEDVASWGRTSQRGVMLMPAFGNVPQGRYQPIPVR